MAQWTGVLGCSRHHMVSCAWLCRNSVAVVANEGRQSMQFQFSGGGNLILAVQSALRDGFHHGNFPLYPWKSSAQHNTVTSQVGSCFQDTPWICRFHNVLSLSPQLTLTTTSHCHILQLGGQEC